jgi:excisionase family DNA binding protein
MMTDRPSAEVEDVIGSAEAAEMLDVTSREVRRKADAGTLSAWREDGPAGPQWRFRRTDVEEYIRQREAGEDRKADARTEGAAVLPATAIIDAQDRATDAALTLADRLGKIADLRDTLQANAEAQADATDAVRELTKIIEQQQQELTRLREELAAERAARRGRDEDRSWWHRLLGGVGGQDRDD